MSGCSIFRPFEDPSAEEPAGGVFRPEGVSAEREEGATNLMRSLGLQSKRRKNKERAESQYAAADQEFATAKTLQGDERAQAFRAASTTYQKAAENWQSSALEQNALLMAGECRFFAEDYYQAEQIYSKLVKEYPKNRYIDHLDSRQFEIANYWFKRDAQENRWFTTVNFTDPGQPWNDTGGHAQRVLEELRQNNPTGKIGDDATMLIATQHYDNGRYEDAAVGFAELRTIYPDSTHQFNAQFLELQSLLGSYHGKDYSAVPLVDAQKRVKQLVRQFPVEAKEKQADINKAYAQIRYSQAERVWHQAEYRMARGENASAKFHLNRITQEYSDTPFGERATETLARLVDAPDDPEQHFKFLAYIFGESTDDRVWLKNRK